MTMERDRRCDAGAADNREPPPALGRRTLEVANLPSTDMTVMGRHANGRTRLDCSRRPGRGRRTGRRGQTEHRNSSSAFELCGPTRRRDAFRASGPSGAAGRVSPQKPGRRARPGRRCSSSIVADLTPLPALPVAGGRETHCPEGADAPPPPHPAREGWLPGFASALHRDARAPVNLTPIASLARHLHRLGDARLALRAAVLERNRERRTA